VGPFKKTLGFESAYETLNRAFVVIKGLSQFFKRPFALGRGEQFQQVQCLYQRLDPVAGLSTFDHYMGLLDFDSHYDEDDRIMQQANARVKEIVTTHSPR